MCDQTERERVQMSISQPTLMTVRNSNIVERADNLSVWKQKAQGRTFPDWQHAFLHPLTLLFAPPCGILLWTNCQNYTELGFKKIRTPEPIFKLIKEFWEANKHLEKVEKWVSISHVEYLLQGWYMYGSSVIDSRISTPLLYRATGRRIHLYKPLGYEFDHGIGRRPHAHWRRRRTQR